MMNVVGLGYMVSVVGLSLITVVSLGMMSVVRLIVMGVHTLQVIMVSYVHMFYSLFYLLHQQYYSSDS